jgi:argonaute-like protein implicated in RNA metabolism and viral defense
MRNSDIIEKFESSIEELVSVFKKHDNYFFFTEKELHSYFYHLCLLEDSFIYKKYNLVHTEYPTPFKCENSNEEPYIKRKDNDGKYTRAHIDLVLINPNFIDFSFSLQQKESASIIMGLKSILFSKYINEFHEIYEKFGKEYNENILLYSLEFKYLRHSHIGEKLPAIEIKRDIQKLKLLEEFKIFNNVPFSKNNKSLVFVGERISEKTIDSIEKIENENKNYCKIYRK